MSAGAVVALEREHALVKRDGAPADRHGRLEHQPLPAELEVCPVDHDEGSLVSEQQGLNDRPIDAVALPLKRPISQQPIDGFDLMLRVRWAIGRCQKFRVRDGISLTPAAFQENRSRVG